MRFAVASAAAFVALTLAAAPAFATTVTIEFSGHEIIAQDGPGLATFHGTFSYDTAMEPYAFIEGDTYAWHDGVLEFTVENGGVLNGHYASNGVPDTLITGTFGVGAADFFYHDLASAPDAVARNAQGDLYPNTSVELLMRSQHAPAGTLLPTEQIPGPGVPPLIFPQIPSLLSFDFARVSVNNGLLFTGQIDSVGPTAVPEPASLALAGIAALAGLRSRRRRA